MDEFFPFLRKVYFFNALDDNEVRDLAQYCHKQHFDTGEIIFEEGAVAEKFYIVLKGSVEIWKDYSQKERDLLAVTHKEKLFGEMALIDDLPRSATVVAREPTDVLFIFRDDFLEILKQNSMIGISILRSISSMVRKSNNKFVDGLRERNKQLENTLDELKATQGELLRAERLSTLGKFSSVILHDIRNPITVIKSGAEMILLNPDKQERVEKYSNSIIREAGRMNRLASELLDYSRGEIRLSISAVNVRDFFDKVLETVRERYKAKHIEIKTATQSGCTLMIDEDRMFRAFMNLTDNAQKALPKGGDILIEADKKAGEVYLRVHDNGVGMNEEVLSKMFDPFYSSSKAGGTGLGMLTVKNVVEAHHGRLVVESRENVGTAVTIILPERLKRSTNRE